MREYMVILRSELFGLFISPATYVASFYFLALLAIGFRFFIESFPTTDWILPPLSSLVMGLIFGSPALIPFLTMRSFAEERRLGTLETLMSAPVGSLSLVFGKWSATYLFFLIICAFAFCFPLLLLLVFPEQGKTLGFTQYEQWVGGWLFLMAFGASFTSLGIFASSITRNQMVAGMLSFTLLTLYLAVMAFSFGDSSLGAPIDGFSDFWHASMGSFAHGLHKLQHFSVGLVDMGTILHQLILGFFFLSLATLQVERLNH